MRGAESRKSNLLGHLSAEPPTKATETLRCTGATVPVPVDEFDVMEPPPDVHELAWACRVLPTEGEKMLDKLSDEQAAVVRAFSWRVPWLRKAAQAAKTRFMTQDRPCQSSLCSDAACTEKCGPEKPESPAKGSLGFQGHSFRG